VTRPDVLLLSLGTTRGWQVADALFLEELRAAGARAAAVRVRLGFAGALRRGYPVNDVVEAIAARRALLAALAEQSPRSLVISTVTAALLAPDAGLPFAVRLDTPASLNRPGARNALVRALERRALSRARLLLPWSPAAAGALPGGAAGAVVLPPPVVGSGGGGEERGRLAVAYVPDPKAKGLDLVCRAWACADVDEARLEVFGIDRARGLRHLARSAVQEPARVEWRGLVPAQDFRAALRRARAFVAAPRWEDFGQAPLEALADGALLVTAAAGGAYAALPIARALDPELVAERPEALAPCLRAAFERDEEALARYRAAAAERLAPYRPEAALRSVREEVLPALLGG